MILLFIIIAVIAVPFILGMISDNIKTEDADDSISDHIYTTDTYTSNDTRDENPRFTFRVDKDTLEAVKEEARRNQRSTGRQIEFILEQWLNENN